MHRDSLKALYEIHSWVGLFLGLALYILLFSGSVALFVAEMRPWELGAITVTTATPITALERIVEDTGTAAAQANFSVRPASLYRPWVIVETGEDQSGGQALTHYDPNTGTRATVAEEHAVHILERLHTDLLLPSPWGRYLVGLLGVAMLVSLISGIFMHRKIFREMWTIRLWRSPRLKWADLHKAVAVWGLPFHLIIAFTGAYLGLVGLTLLLNAFFAFGGDVDAASEGIAGPPLEAWGEAASMLPPGELLDNAGTLLPGITAEYLSYRNYGDRGATLMILGTLPRTLEYFPGVTLSAATGELLGTINWREERWPKALYAMMTPLHYASYGGLLLKTLYALLGLGTSFLVISGLRIWQLRVHPQSCDLRLPLFDGVCYGLPLAIAVLLLTSRLLTEPNFASYQGRLLLFLLVWLTAIVFSFWRRRGHVGAELCIATGFALLMLPLATAWGDRVSILAALSDAPTSPLVLVEGTLAIVGLVTLLTARKLNRRDHQCDRS